MTLLPERMCRAHPDDCPNGPGPHAYYNPQGPVETWAHCPCCADSEYDKTDENRKPEHIDPGEVS